MNIQYKFFENAKPFVKYKDVLDYIISVGCHFYFEYIPLTKFGLPMPEDNRETN